MLRLFKIVAPSQLPNVALETSFSIGKEMLYLCISVATPMIGTAPTDHLRSTGGFAIQSEHSYHVRSSQVPVLFDRAIHKLLRYL